MIDYDKDPRAKRNKAFEQARTKGTYQPVDGHTIQGGHYGIAPVAEPTKPPDPLDNTLKLINELKRKASALDDDVICEVSCS